MTNIVQGNRCLKKMLEYLKFMAFSRDFIEKTSWKKNSNNEIIKNKKFKFKFNLL